MLNLVQVALDLPLDRFFTYKVPAALMNLGISLVGHLVRIRFAGRLTLGMVVAENVPRPEGLRLQPLLGLASPSYKMGPSIVDLALWMGKRWYGSPGEALRCASMVGFQDLKIQYFSWIRPCISADELVGKAGERPKGVSSRQWALFQRLRDHPEGIREKDLLETGGYSREVLRKLVDRGWAEIVPVQKSRDHESLLEPVKPDEPRHLVPEQKRALDRILERLAQPSGGWDTEAVLLHGVTGSGKTEVYLRAAADVLAKGGGVLVLVPEISLTPQAVSRFRARLGSQVGIYHSKMTPGQKLDLALKLEEGSCRVVIGARSAVFAPVKNLRLLVVDEEHEPSYKQDSAPRYHGREVALERGRREGCLVLLGSATPSLESYFRARKGLYELLELPSRVDGRPLPAVTVVDMTAEAKAGRLKDMFSHQLREAMGQALEQKQQVLLFLNRRGYFNFAVCLACQTSIQCPSCDAALTHHKPGDRLICHFCGHTQPLPKSCPSCQNPEVAMLGLGTQRLESSLREDYPSAQILRLDTDTMKKRTAHVEMWRQIESGGFDILVGTQIVAKGIHLEGITVVGVPLADGGLFQPDFRAAERAFSLLTQVAGRAGRGKNPGRVFVQTYVPRHYAIQFAKDHDFLGFFEKEIRIRKVLRFPPYYFLVSLLGTGPEEARVRLAMKEVARQLREAAYESGETFQVLGPAPAPLTRLKDQWRWRLLLRTQSHEAIRPAVLAAVEAHRQGELRQEVHIIVDADPQDLS